MVPTCRGQERVRVRCTALAAGHLAAEHLLDQHRDARPELGGGPHHLRQTAVPRLAARPRPRPAVRSAELEVVQVGEDLVVLPHYHLRRYYVE